MEGMEGTVARQEVDRMVIKGIEPVGASTVCAVVITMTLCPTESNVPKLTYCEAASLAMDVEQHKFVVRVRHDSSFFMRYSFDAKN